MDTNNPRSEEVDIELGIMSKVGNAARMIFAPSPSTRKDEEIFGNESCTSSTSTLVANGSFTLDNTELPRKLHGKSSRFLRYTLLTMYRRLWLIVLFANAPAIIVVSLKREQNLTLLQSIETASAVNLTVAILIRQDLVVNLLFSILGSCPTWLPVRFRRYIANVYHLGGIHSGAGSAAAAWYGMFNYHLFRSSHRSEHTKLIPAVWAVTIVIDFCLGSMIIFSHPGLRSKFHNFWECIHRFVGWFIITLFWTHCILSMEILRQSETPPRSFSLLLSKNPVFWCILLATLAIAIPWFRLRKVAVRSEILSPHAARLYFDQNSVSRCTAPKFSDSPLKEWHAFAGIPTTDETGFSILVSRAGDWTSRIIDNPPKKLWTKGSPIRGVLYMASIFKQLVLVATGSGIGPILSLTVGRTLGARIIWSTRDPVSTFGKVIIEQVRTADPNAIIINTSETGRPDLTREAYKLYISSKAEAVFVISNANATRKIVYGLQSRDVPTFAPIFDS